MKALTRTSLRRRGATAKVIKSQRCLLISRRRPIVGGCRVALHSVDAYSGRAAGFRLCEAVCMRGASRWAVALEQFAGGSVSGDGHVQLAPTYATREDIPDERLEAVPTAERTAEEQARFERG